MSGNDGLQCFGVFEVRENWGKCTVVVSCQDYQI